MKSVSNLLKIEKGFSWSFFGFLLAIIFGSITVYSEFIKDNRPIIQFELLSNAKILNVNEDLSGLNIIYDNIDIKKLGKTISFVTFKISNYGNGSVLKTFYDSASPIGINVENGEIIKSEIISSSNEYIKNNINVNKYQNDSISFSEVILEPNDFYIAKLLVLHSDSQTLNFNSIGKIAGIAKIPIIDTMSINNKPSFWESAFYGSIPVQLVRLPTYFILFVISLFVVIGGPILFSSKIQTRKRRKNIKKFESYQNSTIDDRFKPLIDLYLENGIHHLDELITHSKDEKGLNEAISEYSIVEKKLENENILKYPHWRDDYLADEYTSLQTYYIGEMIKSGILKKSMGNNLELDPEMVSFLDRFVKYMQIKES